MSCSEETGLFLKPRVLLLAQDFPCFADLGCSHARLASPGRSFKQMQSSSLHGYRFPPYLEGHHLPLKPPTLRKLQWVRCCGLLAANFYTSDEGWAHCGGSLHSVIRFPLTTREITITPPPSHQYIAYQRNSTFLQEGFATPFKQPLNINFPTKGFPFLKPPYSPSFTLQASKPARQRETAPPQKFTTLEDEFICGSIVGDSAAFACTA